MYPPRLATTVSTFGALSLALVVFGATIAHAQQTPLFEKSGKPRDLPPALVACPNRRPSALADLLKEQAKDQPILLHLWAPFCAPCKQEMVQIEKNRERIEQEGLKIILLAEDPQGGVSVPAFARRYGLNNDSLCVDAASAVLIGTDSAALPATLLISPQGKILATHKGSLDWAKVPER